MRFHGRRISFWMRSGEFIWANNFSSHLLNLLNCEKIKYNARSNEASCLLLLGLIQKKFRVRFGPTTSYVSVDLMRKSRRMWALQRARSKVPVVPAWIKSNVHTPFISDENYVATFNLLLYVRLQDFFLLLFCGAVLQRDSHFGCSRDDTTIVLLSHFHGYGFFLHFLTTFNTIY